MSKEMGAAVIGLHMGRAHLMAYEKNPHTRIAAICDTNPEVLEVRKKEFKVPVAVTDYRELLGRKDIQVVSVVTPDYFHAEQSIAFMEAGKDIMCDKPMTSSIEEAKEIVKAVKRTGRKFMVGQVCRYAPGFVLARKMIERGEVGKLFFVESEYAHNYSKAQGAGSWRKDPRREPFLGGGCHAVDLLRWIAGEALEVVAYANHMCLLDWPINDCTVALYKFAGNITGKVFVSIGCIRPYTMRSVFYGTEGTIICDNTSPQISLCKKDNFKTSPSFATFPVEIESHNVAEEVNEFVDCILNNNPLLTNEIEGAKTVIAALSAAQSAREGRPVKIEQLS